MVLCNLPVSYRGAFYASYR